MKLSDAEPVTSCAIGDFALDGKSLRLKGINRIGNLLVPNDNYVRNFARNRCRLTMMRAQVMFEEWLTPILDAMVVEQREQGVVWTPSKMIHRMGREIDNPESVYYWCYKNDIPVYSPAITDGSIGDMIFFHSFKTPGLVLDLVQVACPFPASSLSFE